MAQVEASITQESKRHELPDEKRVRHNMQRWYLVHAPKRERTTCDKLRKIISVDYWDDAFVMRKERWRKCDGEWQRRLVAMYQDYFFVATKDAKALDREMAKLSFPARIARSARGCFEPMAPEAQEWYREMLDGAHVIRTSVAALVDGELQIQSGPLMGQESRVVKVDRARRQCLVSVDDGGVGFTECVPLLISVKL